MARGQFVCRRRRDYFNSVAAFYNTRLEVIPDRFVGALAGLRPSSIDDRLGF
ncbi:MAG: hypothetical protein Q7R50_04700 [Dehalococcoidales bacterium]|nr:hypothetical protein [Dehalococcoidales bacterium]